MGSDHTGIKKEFTCTSAEKAVPDYDRVPQNVKSARLLAMMEVAADQTLPKDDPLYHIAVPSNN